MADNELVRQLYSLCRVALENYSIDLWRKQKNKADKEVVMDPATLASVTSYQTNDEILHGSIYVDGHEITMTEGDLFHALERLKTDSMERYEIIIDYYIMEMTDQEIAESLKIPKSTVTWRRHKALMSLEVYLEDIREKDM